MRYVNSVLGKNENVFYEARITQSAEMPDTQDTQDTQDKQNI